LPIADCRLQIADCIGDRRLRIAEGIGDLIVDWGVAIELAIGDW